MPVLRIVAPAAAAGKTAIATAILALLGQGGRLSYRRDGGADHADGRFAREVLGIAESAGSGLVESDAVDDGVDATLAVVPFDGAGTLAAATGLSSSLGSRLLGIVLNAVPAEQMPRLKRDLLPALTEAGIAVLGVIPEVRLLRAGSVREVGGFLEADVLRGVDALDRLVETYVIGAMSHLGASSLAYFQHYPNKAVVTGGNRIDTQLGALATDCRCLILTGGFDPDPVVLERAESQDVSLLRVGAETPEIMERIGAFSRTVRFRHAEKVAAIVEVAASRLDLPTIARALGVPVSASVEAA
jgi:hypothetical protein